MIEAVSFDIDNTLYSYDSCDKAATEALCDIACKQFGLSESTFSERFESAKKTVKDYLGPVPASHNRILR